MENEFIIKGVREYQIYKDAAKFHCRKVISFKWLKYFFIGLWLITFILMAIEQFKPAAVFLYLGVVMPLLLYPLQYWTERRMAKTLYSLANTLDDSDMTATFNNESIKLKSNRGEVFLHYRQFVKCYETTKYFFFYFDRNILTMIIVKDKIDRPIEEFRQHLIHMEMKVIEK